MLLRGQQSSLRLSVTGYQFPLARDPAQKFSWHTVEGTAVVPAGTWDFRYPALTCDESPRVGMWLITVADWLEDPRRSLAPPILQFTEPNLIFRVGPETPDSTARLEIELDQEFRPPWGRERGDPAFTLPLTLTAAALRQAAIVWMAEIRPYPDGIDATSFSSGTNESEP